MVLSCKEISKSYGTDVILESVSFILEETEKCAVIGVNGAGKTTLFKIITEEIQRDSGEIYLKRDARIGYMTQHGVTNDENTLYEEFLSVFDHVLELEANMREMEHRMGGLKGAELEDLMKKYTKATAEFEDRKGYEYQSRIKGVINGLGFKGNEGERVLRTLSGGQKTRVCLGKLLLSEPDILLLDEPTNHLDIESTEWLEDYLRSYSGSIIIISHDRYFLDRIVTKVVEIENKKSKIFNGNYSFYASRKRIDREIMLKHYINQQKEIKRQEEIIRTYRSYATEKAIIRAKSKEKMLAKMERVDKPESMPDTMRIHLTPRKESGNDVLSVKELAKSFNGRRVFRNISFEIKKGEKVAVIGPNGVGKTTLFRVVLGILAPDSGSVRKGVNVSIGYYAQDQNKQLFASKEKTLFNEISDSFPRMTKQEIRDTLAAFIFTGDDVFKTLGSLSGGELGRLALAKIMLGEANFLILDEPTNHLDIFSKEILEQALREYTGTLMYISHDRYFINSTAQKIVELTPEGAKLYMGNYDYYMEKKSEERVIREESVALKPADIERRRKKEVSSDERRRANRLERTECGIQELEQRIGEIDDMIHNDESVYTNAELLGKIYGERTELENKLNELYEEFIELSEDG